MTSEGRHESRRASKRWVGYGTARDQGGKRESHDEGAYSVWRRYDHTGALVLAISEREKRNTVLTASKMCDELGVDTINASGTIAFALDSVSRSKAISRVVVWRGMYQTSRDTRGSESFAEMGYQPDL
jgi:aldehyde:ferredoxin oxidoreductase